MDKFKLAFSTPKMKSNECGILFCKAFMKLINNMTLLTISRKQLSRHMRALSPVKETFLIIKCI